MAAQSLTSKSDVESMEMEGHGLATGQPVLGDTELGSGNDNTQNSSIVFHSRGRSQFAPVTLSSSKERVACTPYLERRPRDSPRGARSVSPAVTSSPRNRTVRLGVQDVMLPVQHRELSES